MFFIRIFYIINIVYESVHSFQFFCDKNILCKDFFIYVINNVSKIIITLSYDRRLSVIRRFCYNFTCNCDTRAI